MDDSLLVGVLHGLADGDEEFQPATDAELGLVAEPGQRQAVDQLHDEERPAVVGHAAVEHAGDVGVVHQRQRLPLLFKALEHGPGVHARLDELEGDRTLDRFGLLGDPDLSHAAFADLLRERVAAGDDGAARRRRRVSRGPGRLGRRGRRVRRVRGAVGRGPRRRGRGRLVGRQQRIDGGAELRLAGAGFVQKGGPLVGVGPGQRFPKQRLVGHGGLLNQRAPGIVQRREAGRNSLTGGVVA